MASSYFSAPKHRPTTVTDRFAAAMAGEYHTPITELAMAWVASAVVPREIMYISATTFPRDEHACSSPRGMLTCKVERRIPLSQVNICPKVIFTGAFQKNSRITDAAAPMNRASSRAKTLPRISIRSTFRNRMLNTR